MKPASDQTYDFNRCKLCGQLKAAPTVPLSDSTLYICAACDFHYLDCLDQVGDNDKVLSDTARSYIEAREGESATLHPARLELVSSLVDKGSKILDIGAGIGQFQLFATAAGFDCRGIEPSSLRRQYAAEKTGLELSARRVEEKYWQQNFSHYFDVITLWDVIEHVNFPRETLEAAIKLLKPNGVLFLDTPSRDVIAYKISLLLSRLSGRSISLFLPSYYSATPFGHKQIFTLDQLTALLNELGLRISHRAKSYTTPGRGDKIILAAGR